MKNITISIMAFLLALLLPVNTQGHSENIKEVEVVEADIEEVESNIEENNKEVSTPIMENSTIKDRKIENIGDASEERKEFQKEKVLQDENSIQEQIVKNEKTAKSNISSFSIPNQEEMPLGDDRIRDGASYWATSNIREWLNSDQKNVKYTNIPPDYKNESGFLYEFTESERNAIAVTKRRSILVGKDNRVRDGGIKALAIFPDGGANTFKYMNHAIRDFNVNWKDYYYHNVNDKVFLLSPHEIHFYIQQKGISLRKQDTNGIYRNWWSTANLWNGNFEQPLFIDSNGFIGRVRTSTEQGIVPAIHLKPTTILNGKKAHELTIGEKVTFGKYNNQAIQWIVINKTPEGYPLLWSERILTQKQYQKQGDKVYRYSESINFAKEDISISDDLKVYNKYGDTKPPKLYVTNRQELDERKNANFMLYLKAEDESGIEKIILDDGTELKSDHASVLIEQNKNYYFQAVDKAGNYTGIMIPINNLNPPATVDIIPSHQGWTNQDVKINIEASNDFEDYQTNKVQLNRFSQNFHTYPNKISYAHKRIRISGEVELIKADRPVDDYRIGVSVTYTQRTPLVDGYIIGTTYPIQYVAKLSEIKNKPKKFDVIMTVGNDYYNNLQVGVRYDYPQVWSVHPYTVEFRNLKYELLDVEDFEIKKITLPSGEEIFDRRYTYTATKTGTYKFDVLDNRGRITSKSIEVKIDKVKPNLSIQPSTTKITHDDVVLNVTATDEGGSGVKRIKSPNGQWVNNNKASYTVKENGSYTFVVEDHAGNQSSKSYTVTNIDKTISFEKPAVSSFGSIILKDKPETISTDVTPILIKDWRDGTNQWKLDVTATPMKLVGESFTLPKGSMKLKPVASINRLDGNGSLPKKGFEETQHIDNGKITVLQSNQSRGEFSVVFPKEALELLIDPTTAKKGKYESTLTWDLISAP
ncbi:DUF6273 domain-containing protein [Siminovitchia sediminis]|uniref:DUF6273 domain-containing protein n=1 Tax=Siminovitchia sediminis TaxID=1274353 RepID=A0ABW4KCV6_9BACI